MSELLKGWTTCKLEDVVEGLQSGFASGKKDVENGLKHLRMNNIGVDGKLNLELLRTVPSRLANRSHYLEAGDVLICTTNSGKLVGKCALFELNGDFAFSNHLTKVRANRSAIESQYLLYHLWFLWKEGDFEHSCKHWVNQSTLPKEELLATRILLPPLREQRRIVVKLEKLLSRVDGVQARLETIPRILKRFRQSVLAAACSGKLTADWRKEPKVPETAATFLVSVRSQRRERWTQAEMAKKSSNRKGPDKYPDPREIVDDDLPDLPEEWAWASLDEVSYRLTYGITVRPQYVEDGVAMISAREIRSGEVDLLKANRISRSDYDGLREKCRIYFGDVLFSKTGTVGSVARVKTDEPLCSSQNIAVISPLIESAFLEIVLRSSTFQQRALDAVKNTAVSDLQLGIMACFPIPIPPLTEQREIVRRVEALFKTAVALERRYRTAKAHVDKLTQSLLAKAFRGELVPQDPNDEPAEKLLERIRSERENGAKPRAKTRKQRL